jgi:hypothetical protein
VAVWNVRVEARWCVLGVVVLMFVLCLCFVSCCLVLFCIRGCRRRMAAGGVGDGEMGSVRLYNVGNLNKLVVLFFSPPPPPHHHRFALRN